MAAAQREWIYGRNPVHEALRARRRHVYEIKVAVGSDERGLLERVISIAQSRKVPLVRVARDELEHVHGNHQGVIAAVAPYPYTSLEDILERADRAGEAPWILILDRLQDPQNVGALLRTAEAVGVHGVVMPSRQSVGVTPAVVRASAGACEHLAITRMNLVQAIEALKKSDVWIAGLENSPQAGFIDEVPLQGAAALVLGSEGQGMRRLVSEACDFRLRIPMRGQVESLNASVAGAIALYTLWRQRGYLGAHQHTAEHR